MAVTIADAEYVHGQLALMTKGELTAARQLAEQELRHAAENSLHEFAIQAWPIVEPTQPFVDGWHLRAICEHLEACSRGDVRNLLVNMPPRCCKSLLVSVFWFCWSWTHDPGATEWMHGPSSRWMYASYASTLSARDSVKCRNIITSPWYQTNWGDRFRLKDDQNVKSRFENDRTGLRLATSVGALATGEGADVLVGDDLLNVQQAGSDTQRSDAIDWWGQTMSTRGNDPRSVVKVIVEQRLHESDISGSILESVPDEWEHLVLPMEYDPKRSKVTSLGWRDPRTDDGELLWPGRFGHVEVESLKRSLGAYAASGQLQQQPSPDRDGLFDRHNFRYFKVHQASKSDIDQRASDRDEDDALLDEMFGAPDVGEEIYELEDEGVTKRYFRSDLMIFQTVDTAMRTTEHADHTAIATVAATPDGRILLLDMIRERVPVAQQFNLLMRERERWPDLKFQAVEAAASGHGLIEQGAAEGRPFRVLKADRDKVTRAVPLSTFYQNSRVFHLANNKGTAIYEDELLAFPRGAHDDTVDVMAHAALLVAERGSKRFFSVDELIPDDDAGEGATADVAADVDADDAGDDLVTDADFYTAIGW